MLNTIFTNGITAVSLIICIIVAIVLGLLTALVFLYRSRHSASFALTLSLLPMTVAIIIMLVNGNIGAGVAVAGAFALVRFRSVPGTAREIAAIFTAMALGLALGMGYVGIAVIFFAFTAVLTLILTRVNFGAASRYEKHLKITIPESFDYNGLFDDVFDKYTTRVHLEQVKTTNMGTLFELTYSVTMNDTSVPKDFLDELRTRNGNLNISIGDLSDKDMM
ncbi:MAG: DUF4956 domain-containing protein [Oscillospiraceae bacterium]|nr:DUF4956 domain-containing protein [Oscillospiraceae bacterium]